MSRRKIYYVVLAFTAFWASETGILGERFALAGAGKEKTGLVKAKKFWRKSWLFIRLADRAKINKLVRVSEPVWKKVKYALFLLQF